MGIFASTQGNIKLSWVNEVVLMAPMGPVTIPEVQIIYNGLVQPHEEDVSITFVCRGEIYDLKDISSEWKVQNNVNEDWFTREIFLNSKLRQDHMIESMKNGKIAIKYRREDVPIEATIAEIHNFNPKLTIHCSDTDINVKNMSTSPLCEEKNPLFSTIQLHFKDCKEKNIIFRLCFKTKYNVSDYSSQITLDMEGPAVSYKNIINEILRIDPSSKQRSILMDNINNCYTNIIQPHCEIAVVGHPSMPLTIKNDINIGPQKDFPLESKGTPIRSAASPTKVSFLSKPSNEFKLTAAIDCPYYSSRIGESPEFIRDLEVLNTQLRAKKNKNN